MDLEFPTLDLEAPIADDNAEVVETPIDENAELTPEVEGEEEPSAVEEPEEEPADGRKAPDEVRKALKALRDSSPENAKAAQVLRDSFGREQAYKAVWPTVKDAQAAQSTIQTIESYGGLEQIQSTIAEIEEIDQLLAAGDTRAVDKIFEVSGEGFGKLAPAVLDKLQASNPEAYANAIRPHLVSAIGQSGLSEAFAAVLQAQQFAQTPNAPADFKAKWEKEAGEGLTKIHQYLQSLGKQQPAATQPVQQNDAFTKREQELATKEAAQFNNEVGTLANKTMNGSLAKAMTPYLRGVKLDQDARAEFTKSIYDEVAKLAKADTNYQKSKDALFKSKTRDAAKVANLMSSKFDTVVGQAAKTVAARPQWKALLSKSGTPVAVNPGAPAAPAPGGNGSLQKPILVNELPDRKDVDFSRTDDDMMIRGIRVLKSGKVIKLNR